MRSLPYKISALFILFGLVLAVALTIQGNLSQSLIVHPIWKELLEAGTAQYLADTAPAARKELPLNQQGKCTSTQQQVAGGLNVSFSCTDPASSGTGQIRFQGDNAYTMTMNVRNNSGAGPQNATVVSNGRWLSATCPAAPR